MAPDTMLLLRRPCCCWRYLPRTPLRRTLLALVVLPAAAAACAAAFYAVAAALDLDADVLASGLLFFGGVGPTAYYSALCNTSTVPASSAASAFEVSPFHPDLPLIYFVTPTFSRPEQLPELMRLGQTLLHVRNLVWLVAEDRDDCSEAVASALEEWAAANTPRSPRPVAEGEVGRRPYVHLVSPMPSAYRFGHPFFFFFTWIL